MTVPIYGRVTPIQGLMLGLAGEIFHTSGVVQTDESRLEQMRQSRAILTRLAGVDFGFDLPVWHERLLASEAHSGQYTHPYARKAVRPKIVSLLHDHDRLRLVALLSEFGSGS